MNNKLLFLTALIVLACSVFAASDPKLSVSIDFPDKIYYANGTPVVTETIDDTSGRGWREITVSTFIVFEGQVIYYWDYENMAWSKDPLSESFTLHSRQGIDLTYQLERFRIPRLDKTGTYGLCIGAASTDSLAGYTYACKGLDYAGLFQGDVNYRWDQWPSKLSIDVNIAAYNGPHKFGGNLVVSRKTENKFGASIRDALEARTIRINQSNGQALLSWNYNKKKWETYNQAKWSEFFKATTIPLGTSYVHEENIPLNGDMNSMNGGFYKLCFSLLKQRGKTSTVLVKDGCAPFGFSPH